MTTHDQRARPRRIEGNKSKEQNKQKIKEHKTQTPNISRSKQNWKIAQHINSKEQYQGTLSFKNKEHVRLNKHTL